MIKNTRQYHSFGWSWGRSFILALWDLPELRRL